MQIVNIKEKKARVLEGRLLEKFNTVPENRALQYEKDDLFAHADF